MRKLAVAIILLLFAAARSEAGGPEYEIKSSLVHQVETDGSKIVFTISGRCALYIQAPDREDKANRVETALKRCVITITEEAFKKSGERTVMTWADCQKSAKALKGKTAFMQLSGTATFVGSRITSIQAAGTCYFRPESEGSQPDGLPSQRAALELVQKLGGTLAKDESRAVVAIYLWNGSRPFRGTQRTTVSDSDLEKLKGVTTVRELDLEGTQITDKALQHLHDMKSLRQLGLNRTKITDAGLAELADLENLEELRLCDTQITNAGLVQLSRLTNLQELWLDDTKITDKGLGSLKGLTNLRVLFMHGTNVTDAGLKHLTDLKKLERVLLHQTYCTREGVNELARNLPHFEAYEVSTRVGKSH